MPERDPASEGPQPEGAEQRAGPEQGTAPGSGTAAPASEAATAQPPRPTPRATEQEVARVVVEEKARQLARERRGAEAPTGIVARVRDWFSPRAHARTERQLSDRYVRDFERMEALNEKLKSGQELTAEEQRELSAIEKRIEEGQAIQLTDAERREVERIALAIEGKVDKLTAEDQAILQRWQKDDWWERHPTLKAVLIGGAGGGVAGLGTKAALGGTIRQVAALAGAPAIIGTAVAGALFGGIQREYTVHRADQWTKDLGLNIADEKIRGLSTEDLTRMVGVARNVIEKNAVRGSRAEYFNFLVQYRKASEELTRRGLEIRGTKPQTREQEQDARFYALMERLKEKEASEKEVEEFIKRNLSEQEKETYASLQRGKGKQVLGAALLGAGVGAAVGGLASFLANRTPSLQEVIDRYHLTHFREIMAQRERAGMAVEELAKKGVSALGFSQENFATFTQQFAQGAPATTLIQEGFKNNIDLRVPVEGVPFVEWLQSHREWFNSLPINVKAEVISHPDLAPQILERGTDKIIPVAVGVLGLAGGILGWQKLERAGRTEIKHDIEESRKRYREGSNEKAVRLAEESAYQEKGEREKKEQIKKAEEEAYQKKEMHEKTEREIIERIAGKIVPGQRYKKGKTEWTVTWIAQDPRTDRWYLQFVRTGAEGQEIEGPLVELSDLLKKDKRGVYIWKFAGPPRKEEMPTKKTGTERRERPPGRKVPERRRASKVLERRDSPQLPGGEMVMKGETWIISGAPYRITDIVHLPRKGWVIKGELTDPEKYPRRKTDIVLRLDKLEELINKESALLVAPAESKETKQ